MMEPVLTGLLQRRVETNFKAEYFQKEMTLKIFLTYQVAPKSDRK